MRSLAVLLIACGFLLLNAPTAFAGEGQNPCEHQWKSKIFNECSPHTIDTDTDTHADRDDPAGVGIDLLITEGENLDFVAEYRHDFNNNEDSIFGVFKTKKSLWSIVKSIFNR